VARVANKIDRKAVEQDYLGGMKYKDLAAKYGVTINTVKSWKTRYKWARNGVHTGEKVCIQKKSARTPKEKPLPELPEAEELTAKERLFCEIFDRNHNATQAYAKAYGCTYDSARSSASTLLTKPNIKAYLAALRRQRREAFHLEPDDIVERMMRIAFSDLGDYVFFGQREVDVTGPFGPITVTNAEGEEENLKKIVNYVDLNDARYVDTALISEISQGRDGVKIKLADHMKAYEWLMQYFEWMPQDKHKVEFEKNRIALQERAVKVQEDKLHGVSEDVEKIKEGLREIVDIINNPVPDRKIEGMDNE